MNHEAVEATGETVEDAIDAALARLGATEDEVEIQILSEGDAHPGRRGESARVRVRRRDERGPGDLHDEEDADIGVSGAVPEHLEDEADAAHDFLEGLLEVLKLEGEVAADATPGGVEVEVTGSEMALLIGKRGATLDALQELVRAAVQREVGGRPRINVDVEGYKRRQRASLERRARELAARVRKTRRAVRLEPMSSYQRKIVHDALSRMDGVTTTSEGEEPNRRIVINPAPGAAAPPPRRPSRR